MSAVLKSYILEVVNTISPDKVAEWKRISELPENKPWLDPIKNATDISSLNAAKRRLQRADDAGKLTISAGVWSYFYELRKEELTQDSYNRRTHSQTRADRVLRVRDSTGKARARRRS